MSQQQGLRSVVRHGLPDHPCHLACRACGRTEDVDLVVGPAPCLAPEDASGYTVDDAEVVFWGLCPDCRIADRER